VKARILVVDDDSVLCKMLVDQLSRKGYEALAVKTLEEGVREVEGGFWDVVLLDVQMPDGNGLEFLPRFVQSTSLPEVIIVTGHGAPDGAEKAIRGGAWNYIEKPHVIRDLSLHLSRALQYRQEKQRSNTTPIALKRKNIIGESEIMRRCYDELARAAGSEVNVLFTGETGTGKEVFAQALHENSNRSGKRFVVVDCASLPESLIESALFGHVRGAFTGADREKEGLIKLADGGTLFLDEVGELPATMQKTFLRVLQERAFRPIGGAKEVRSNFRLVAATNRNLDEMVESGSFRRDLLFRLKGLEIHLPTLRDDKEDI
jgi:two-component system NtrC family response regulator